MELLVIVIILKLFQKICFDLGSRSLKLIIINICFKIKVLLKTTCYFLFVIIVHVIFKNSVFIYEEY